MQARPERVTTPVETGKAGLSNAALVENEVEAGEVQEKGGGRWTGFSDPDGNAWGLQQLPPHS